MAEIKLYKSPWRSIKLLLMATVLISSGVWLITLPDSPNWIGWMAIFLFGPGVFIALFHLVDRRPQIKISELGIWNRTTKEDVINWEIIDSAYMRDVNGVKIICVKVDESFEPSRKKGNWYKGIAKINKGMGFQELNISLDQIKIDESRFTEFINLMSKLDPEEKMKTLESKREEFFGSKK